MRKVACVQMLLRVAPVLVLLPVLMVVLVYTDDRTVLMLSKLAVLLGMIEIAVAVLAEHLKRMRTLLVLVLMVAVVPTGEVSLEETNIVET